MHLRKEKRFRRTGSALRFWLKSLFFLLIVAGLTSQMVHAAPSFAGAETAEASNLIFVPEQPHDAMLGVTPAVPHCHSLASCGYLPVKFVALFRMPKSGGWIPSPPRYHISTVSERQFRPPRLPAHF